MDRIGHLRILATDRDLATRWLAAALPEGRLSVDQDERRLADLAGAQTYGDLDATLDGVPGRASNAREGLLVSTVDREEAVDRLSQALADGVLTVDEHAKLRASAQRAKRYRDLDGIAAKLVGRVGAADRASAVRRLDRAQAEGRLGAEEHAARVADANSATWEDELARLLAGLPGRAPARSLLPSMRPHRLSDGEREQAVQELQQALGDGRLTLDEYEQRTRAAHAAETARDLKPLLADLIAPEPTGSVEIGDWHRFTGASIGSFLGLTPAEHSSGASRTLGPITKTGNGHVRRLLVEAAWHHRPLLPDRKDPAPAVGPGPSRGAGARRSGQPAAAPPLGQLHRPP